MYTIVQSILQVPHLSLTITLWLEYWVSLSTQVNLSVPGTARFIYFSLQPQRLRVKYGILYYHLPRQVPLNGHLRSHSDTDPQTMTFMQKQLLQQKSQGKCQAGCISEESMFVTLVVCVPENIGFFLTRVEIVKKVWS